MDFTLNVASRLLQQKDSNFELYFCNVKQSNPSTKQGQDFIDNLVVQKILQIDLKSSTQFIKLGLDQKWKLLNRFNMIFHRMDPPVNDEYSNFHQHFEDLPSTTLQFNDPKNICTLHEHLIPHQYFKEYAAPTSHCNSLENLIEATTKHFKDSERIVLKPESQKGGVGIQFLTKTQSNQTDFLNNYFKQWGPQIVVQQYLPEIEKTGDMRVLCFNGNILGNVLRVPQKGSRLANLHQGALAVKHPISQKQKLISEQVSKQLLKQFKLYLIGIDFIGDYLTEVNITSPTLIEQCYQNGHPEAYNILIKELQNLAKK